MSLMVINLSLLFDSYLRIVYTEGKLFWLNAIQYYTPPMRIQYLECIAN